MLTLRLLFVSAAAFTVASAQTNSAGITCVPTANPPLVRVEGVTERLGDIVLSCSGGGAGTAVNANFSVFINTNITNRIDTAGLADAVLTIDNGSGPVPSPVKPRLAMPNQLAFDGVNFTLSTTGQATLRFSNIRADVTQIASTAARPVTASIAVNGPNQVALTGAQVVVGQPAPSLYSQTLNNSVICSQYGTPLPKTVNWDNLISSGAAFSTGRITEGYATAFARREPGADTGLRIISHFGSFPAGSRLFVPEVIAGSSAPQPTSAGDFGKLVSAGEYKPGTLLLVLVRDTDSNGAGGTVAWTGTPSTPPFGSMREVSLGAGEGIAVYEVVDSDPGVIENAQIPAFLGLPGREQAYTAVTTLDFLLGPVSTANTASEDAPIPRFTGGSSGSDCTLNGDCGAAYYPKLLATYEHDSLIYEIVQGGKPQSHSIRVENVGAGTLSWFTSIAYKTGKDWLRTYPDSGTDIDIRVEANPKDLAVGTYQATLTIDGGLAGRAVFPVSLTIKAGSPATAPAVTQLIHAATYASGPFVAGSLATIKGTFSGQRRSVTFDGLPAKLTYQDDKQINLLVPAELENRSTSQMVVTVDGTPSAAVSVPLTATSPGIFPRGVLNQDYSANEAANPGASGSVLQIYATGLFGSAAETVVVKLGDRALTPEYAGAAPGFPGVQQVNVRIPEDAPTGNADLRVCTTVCSPAVQVSVRQ